MEKENESSGAILGDISTFQSLEEISSASSLSRFIRRLDSQLAHNRDEFQEQIDRINRGVLGSSRPVNEKVLVDKIQSLEHKVRVLEEENFQLHESLETAENEKKNLEKKLALSATEISRLKHGKISSLNSRRPTPTTVDVDKYRRALLYIDELQHRLRTN